LGCGNGTLSLRWERLEDTGYRVPGTECRIDEERVGTVAAMEGFHPSIDAPHRTDARAVRSLAY